MPEVSVVIPSYNHAAYIAEAVNSVLNQSLSDLELIVVDDGSSDASLDVLAKFSDPRMYILTQSNQGAHAAINRGLHAACGDFLAILNSDDAYHLQRLEKAIGVLKANAQIGLVGSYIQIVDHQGKALSIKHGYQDCSPWPLEFPERSFRAGDELRATLLTENYLATTSNYVFSREGYERVGDFRPLRYTHDWDFALRMAQVAQLELLPEALIRYRIHPANTIRENRAAMIFEICWILAVHLPNYIADQDFLNRQPTADRIDQLLHSIYVYGAERVLSMMLLQNLHHNMGQAMQLLDPSDPTRLRYLDFILQQISAQGGAEGAATDLRMGNWKFKLSKILSRFSKYHG
jgi:glycosyltransferase involved in cell wall biosynthesis